MEGHVEITSTTPDWYSVGIYIQCHLVKVLESQLLDFVQTLPSTTGQGAAIIDTDVNVENNWPSPMLESSAKNRS